jgi:hypothetical protein
MHRTENLIFRKSPVLLLIYLCKAKNIAKTRHEKSRNQHGTWIKGEGLRGGHSRKNLLIESNYSRFQMTQTNDQSMTPQHTPVASNTTEAGAISPADIAFAAIRDRLDPFFPNDPYLPDATLAKTIGISQKTLANRRSENPEKYRHPLNWTGARAGMHPRVEFIDWLARQALFEKARVVHRCL